MSMLCPGNFCCPANNVCCSGGKCCPSSYPVCQTNICCPTGTVACGSTSPNACHPPGTVCCANELINCPAGTLCCGTDAPGFCHPVGTQCCRGTNFNCPITSECCGDGCCPSTDDDGDPLKCGKGPGGQSSCCGEYETHCDGYCCGEGATCAGNGMCQPARLEWDDVEHGLELCYNTCLGIRSQLFKPGVEYIGTQYQLLQYSGPGTGDASRDDGPCKGGTCCSGIGSTYQCDEYPYASTYEGGDGAWAACIPQEQNSKQGATLGTFLQGRHDGFQFYVVVLGATCDSVAKDALLKLNPECPMQVTLPY
ncbi:hypothetical protein B0O99DRAFT_599726 [Bisporella sp. PMI_857]|nr:hypothetical protein B0O99DRAFT_599726 [Bisporella sp. PMI_857]